MEVGNLLLNNHKVPTIGDEKSVNTGEGEDISWMKLIAKNSLLSD